MPTVRPDGTIDWTDTPPLTSIGAPATAGAGAGNVPITSPATATAPAVRNGTATPEPAPAPTPTNAPTLPTPSASDTTRTSGLLAQLNAEFPWLATIGLTPAWFQDTAASSTSDAEVVAKLRSTDQYKTRFAGILRDNGAMRMTEAAYIGQEDGYRQLLRQYGVDAGHMDNPADFVGFFNSDIDPNELKQRLDTYKNIKDGGQGTMDAFYVYSGMKVSVDDLYAATVDPAAAQRLTDEYNQKVAAQPLDYTTWITRATQAGLSRVAATLGALQTSGALTGNAVQSVLAVSPDFARTIMDALYHGGDPTSGQTLNLQDLLATFEEAAIGSAATGAGLVLPDKARIMALRAAGVTKAAAQQAYGSFSANKDLYAGAVQRMTNSSRSFTQADFEDASMLGVGTQADALARAQAQEASYGVGAGQFQIDQNKRKQFTQSGLVTH